MVSRDTIVHVVAVLLAFVLLFAVEYVDLGADTGPAPVPVFVLFYAIVLGGAHLYLAVRGEDGLIPVEARWRYVAMLAVVLGASAASYSVDERTIVGVEFRAIATALAVVAVVAYFLTESVAGYRASRSA